MESTVLFQHPLGLFPEKPEELAVLKNNALFWQVKGERQQLSLQDVVGVSLVEPKESEFPCLLIHSYPKVNTNNSKKRSRVLQEYCFTCPNRAVRDRWQQAVNNSLAKKLRHLQVIINPVSGQKRAAQIFERVRPLLDRSYLKYSVRETHGSDDIKNFASNLDLAKVDGLIIVGGDGTVSNTIAGLMNRPDWKKAIELPLGIIPGGTGNGLAKSLLAVAGETYDPLNAAFLIAKGKQQSLDLAAVQQKDRQYYSFLSLAWGLISDVDIGSEKLKFLGSLRFDLYALLLICLLRTYKGKFSFVPHPDCKNFQRQATSKQGKWEIIEDDFIFVWAMNAPWAAHDMNVAPNARLDDGAIDVLAMRRGTPRWEVLKALLLCGKGKHLNLPHMEYYKVCSFKLEPQTRSGLLVVDGEPVDYSPIKMEVISGLARVN